MFKTNSLCVRNQYEVSFTCTISAKLQIASCTESNPLLNINISIARLEVWKDKFYYDTMIKQSVILQSWMFANRFNIAWLSPQTIFMLCEQRVLPQFAIRQHNLLRHSSPKHFMCPTYEKYLLPSLPRHNLLNNS